MAKQEENGPARTASAFDAGEIERLVPIVYDELRRIAHRQLRGERSDHTLDTTGLVHEAYLKLSRLERIEWRDRGHFLAAAAGVMRRARSRATAPATWGAAIEVPAAEA